MNRRSFRPSLGLAIGLVLCASGLHAAPPPPTEPAAPSPKPGWTSRLAAAPKKLAFWNKKEKEAAPAAAVPIPKKATPGSQPISPVGQPTPVETKPTAAAKPPKTKKTPSAAVAAPEPAPEPAPAKKSLFSKLPSLPFIGKSAAPSDPGDPAPATASTRSEAQRADAKRAQSKKLPDDAVRIPAEAEAAKPSLWARMAAAVRPGDVDVEKPQKPQTAPIPKGLAALGVTAPDPNSFVVTKDQSAFYSYGPQQATPPDAYLPTGTIVTLNTKTWGWATIQLPDGRTGIVDRSALRPALVTDLIPSRQLGDPLMASLSPNQLKRSPTPSFILPTAEMPDLPTSGDTSSSGAPGNPLLLPFSPDDITDPGSLPPIPEIPPLPEPADPAPPAAETPASAPEPAPAPEPAAPSEPADLPDEPASP